PSLHIPLIVGVGLYASTALAGGLQRAFATLPGKLLVAMTGLMILASLFGAWKGGSSKLLTDQWSKAFPLYFTVVGLCLTSHHVFRFLRTIALGIAVLST